MEKPADTNLDIHFLLKKRYSPRAFDNRPVETDKINRILEAGRWSPSASNDQPWRFIVGVKGEDSYYDHIFGSLVEFNRIWCKNVPVLIVMVGDRISAKSGGQNPFYQYDLGQAAAHMTMQAMEEGLWCHQMGGFEKQKLIENFDIPEQFDPMVVMALGHKGALEVLPEKFQEMEKQVRQRKPMEEIEFKGVWKS